MRWDQWSEKRVRRCWRLSGSILGWTGGEAGGKDRIRHSVVRPAIVERWNAEECDSPSFLYGVKKVVGR